MPEPDFLVCIPFQILKYCITRSTRSDCDEVTRAKNGLLYDLVSCYQLIKTALRNQHQSGAKVVLEHSEIHGIFANWICLGKRKVVVMVNRACPFIFYHKLFFCCSEHKLIIVLESLASYKKNSRRYFFCRHLR